MLVSLLKPARADILDSDLVWISTQVCARLERCCSAMPFLGGRARADSVDSARAVILDDAIDDTARAVSRPCSSRRHCARALGPRACTCQGCSNGQGSSALKKAMYEARWLEDRAAARQEQRALHARIRALQRPLQKQQRRAARMRPVLQRAALLVLAWTAPETEPAALYLAQERARHDAAAVPTLERVVEEYLSLSAEALPVLVLGGGDTPARAMALARHFMRKSDLRAWIAEQNETKGLAPTTDLVQRRLLLADQVRGPLQPLEPPVNPALVSTKWVQRFRRQWQLRRGSHQPRETLPQEVLLRRAPQGAENVSGFQFPARKFCAADSKTGAVLRPRFRGRASNPW